MTDDPRLNFPRRAGLVRPATPTAALETARYIVPSEDRQSNAAAKHEVRYFHDNDKEAAQRLAEDTTAALRELGYASDQIPNIVVKSLVTFPGKKPRLGVLELWVEIPPTS